MWGDGHDSEPPSRSGSYSVKGRAQQSDDYLTSKWSQTAKFLRDLTRRKAALAAEIRRQTAACYAAAATGTELAGASSDRPACTQLFGSEPGEEQPHPARSERPWRYGGSSGQVDDLLCLAKPQAADQGDPYREPPGSGATSVPATLDWLLQSVLQRSSAVSSKLIKSCVLSPQEEVASRTSSKADTRSPLSETRKAAAAHGASSLSGRARARSGRAAATKPTGTARPTSRRAPRLDQSASCSSLPDKHAETGKGNENVKEQAGQKGGPEEERKAAVSKSCKEVQEEQEEVEEDLLAQLRRQALRQGSSAPASPRAVSPRDPSHSVPALPPVARSVSSPLNASPIPIPHAPPQPLSLPVSLPMQRAPNALQQEREARDAREAGEAQPASNPAWAERRSLRALRAGRPTAAAASQRASRKALMSKSCDGTTSVASQAAPQQLQQQQRGGSLPRTLELGGGGRGGDEDTLHLPRLNSGGSKPALAPPPPPPASDVTADARAPPQSGRLPPACDGSGSGAPAFSSRSAAHMFTGARRGQAGRLQPQATQAATGQPTGVQGVQAASPSASGAKSRHAMVGRA